MCTFESVQTNWPRKSKAIHINNVKIYKMREEVCAVNVVADVELLDEKCVHYLVTSVKVLRE